MAAVVTTEAINVLVSQDTKVVARMLTENSLVGTEIGDRVLAAFHNDPERYDALVDLLKRLGMWSSFE